MQPILITIQGTDLIRTSDGGYAILCNYENGSDNGVFVIFTDEFGRQKTGSPYDIPATGNVHGYSMIEIDDGYLISGSLAAADSINGYLVVISGDGRILREKKIRRIQGIGIPGCIRGHRW